MSTDHSEVRVVVTRSSDQASRLSDGLRRHGLTPVEVPLIAMQVTDQHRGGLREALSRLRSFDWVTLTSPNAATVFFDAIGSSAPFMPKIAVVGPGTDATVRLRGHVPSLVAETASGEGLLAEMQSSSPGNVLCPQAAAARPTLADGLRAAGWNVTTVETYQTVPVLPSDEVLQRVATCDAIAFASSSSVEAWVEAVPNVSDRVRLTPALVVSIGPQTTATAQAAGFIVAGEASPHTIEGLVAAVVVALAARGA